MPKESDSAASRDSVATAVAVTSAAAPDSTSMPLQTGCISPGIPVSLTEADLVSMLLMTAPPVGLYDYEEPPPRNEEARGISKRTGTLDGASRRTQPPQDPRGARIAVLPTPPVHRV